MCECKMWTTSVCFIIFMLRISQALGRVISNDSPLVQEYLFDALQCNDVRTTASYSGRQFCQEDKIKKEFGISDRRPWGEMTVIQYNSARRFKGVKCEKRISAITAVCGAFSHSKLVAPPDVMMPVMVPQKDCALASQSSFISTEDQRQLRISMGSANTYKYIESGQITFSETNVACEGGELKIHGKKHENLIRLVTVNFVMTEVDVYERQGRLRTNTDGVLPRACNLAFEGCALEEMTLVIDLSKINLCQYVRIRSTLFEEVQGEVETSKLSVISDEHKMLFEIGARIEIPSECNIAGTLIRTNFERIFLYNGALGNGIDMIDPAEIDLELETRVTDYYLAHWAENVMMESEVKWRNELCQLSSQRLSNDQIILHDRHLLKMQGELISEFTCTPITVRTRSGHRMEGDTCLDHLPVFLPDDKIGYLTPITRIIVQRNAVSTVNCSMHYPYLFEDNSGQMITANPAVKAVQIELADHHFLDSKSHNHTDVFKFSSLLYTPEEIQSYEQMLQGHSAEKAVTRKFSSFYCGTTGECAPSRGKTDFQWNKLVNPTEFVSEWWEQTKEKLLNIGACWGLICSMLTIGHLVAKLVIVARNIGKRQLTKGAIFRFVFLPGHELVSLFPRQEETARYRRNDSSIHLNLEQAEMQSMMGSTVTETTRS